MKCLRCNAEFEEGFTICSDCKVPLVPDHHIPEVLPATVKTVQKVSESEEKHLEESQTQDLDRLLGFLEVMKFNLRKDDESFIATHSGMDPIVLTEYENGVLFEAWYSRGDEALNRRGDYLEFVNQFNNDSPLLKASDRMEEEAFVVDAWIPLRISTEDFSIFIKMFVAELTGVLYRYENFKIFLKPYKA